MPSWRRTHLLGCLRDKAEAAGIEVVLVNERRTSSTCPECARVVNKPKGRPFACQHCGHTGHRDVVGARNIAARGADPRMPAHASRTVGLGIPQHCVIGAVICSTGTDPARPRAARETPGVARR